MATVEKLINIRIVEIAQACGSAGDSYDVYYLVIQSHVFQADLP